MFNEGKQQLQEHIINKRTNEDPEKMPEDLGNMKQMLQEKTEEEIRSVIERRRRNKEAAERSRKKKKVEFEKLQTENDQLNQDKCELVAMVQKMKEDIDEANQQKEAMRDSYEQLKRWIGKRSDELGVIKFSQNDGQNPSASDASTFPTEGEPMLIKSSNDDDKNNASNDTPMPPKQHSPSNHLRFHVQTPWCVEPMSNEKPERDQRAVMSTMQNYSTPKLPQNQPAVVVSSPKVFIDMQRNPGSQQTGTPQPPQITITTEPPEFLSTELPKMSGSNMASVSRNVEYKQPTSGYGDKLDQATTTAIESLLKLSAKNEPYDVLPKSAAEPASNAVAADHTFKAPVFFTVPMNTMESIADIVVTTTKEPNNTQNRTMKMKQK